MRLYIVTIILTLLIISPTEIMAKRHFSSLDVSFFLPVPLRPNQTVSILENFKGKSLFSQKLWNQLTQVPNGMLTTTSMVGSPFNPADFSISSFRYSPCEPHIFPDMDPKKCKFSVLRIVAQSLSSDGDNPPSFFSKKWGLLDPERFYHDSALHLIYIIPKEKRISVEKALWSIKMKAKELLGLSTKGKYLGVHPGFEALEDPKASSDKKKKSLKFFSFFKETLYSMASTKNLLAVSEMRGTRNGNIGQWIFAGNLRDLKTGNLISKDISGLQKGESRKTHVVSFSKGVNLGEKFIVDKSKVGPVDDTIVPKTGGVTNSLGLKRIFKVLNPEQTVVLKGDCVSCHMASPLLSKREVTKGKNLGLSAGEKKQLEAFSYNPKTNDASIKGEKTSLEPSIIKMRGNKKNGTFLVTNFGRCAGRTTNQKLCISQRTLNETLQVLRLLNK